MKKTTPQKLSKRLSQYGALSLAIVGVTDAAGQQITYTPVNLTFGIGDEYFLNLDNNGPDEFRIFHNGYSSLSFNPLDGNNEVLGSIAFSYYAYPYALIDNDVISISASGVWTNYGYNIGYNFLNYGSQFSYCSVGNWCNVTDKFLGLRFKIGANTHYGWARMSVDAIGDVWTIKDYAYHETADTQILAGEGAPLGINDNVFNTVKIVALNKSIALFNLPQQTNYRLFSITGKSVLDGKITNNTYVIEANTLASGIYIIELKDNTSNAVIRKKIVL